MWCSRMAEGGRCTTWAKMGKAWVGSSGSGLVKIGVRSKDSKHTNAANQKQQEALGETLGEDSRW
jgi:hypothetical protein